ncbi:hypothetical protein EDD96_3061 [Streptomyces sp. Ag109_G2-6]|uniref:hypothetical protein n=1 Tax=Streptomyces TaxID=1883 RepID=UPI0009A50BCD|nr:MULTISPECIES: hypothetical protein [Streptomyces]RPF46483.1 hypothetical protein EDD96_3061 [Streptomyces sp. Ag109_G2-6]
MTDLVRYGAPVGSFIVAIVALYISVRLNRRQRQITRLEIARNLHGELISDSAIKDRHTLGTIHWQNRSISSKGGERGDVMCAYFAMLWRFERLHAGRKVLLEENGNAHDIALTILDNQIRTHVQEYVCTFHEIRAKLTESDKKDPVFDGAYVDSFGELCRSLAATSDEDSRKKLRFHTNNSETCLCACHKVNPRPPLPGQNTRAAVS